MGIRMKATRMLDNLPIRPGLFTQSLPADVYTESIDESTPRSDSKLKISRAVHNAAFSYTLPDHNPDPELLAVSTKALDEIELDPEAIHTDEFLQVFSGNKILENTRPYSAIYGGHQFGIYAGQLGDGRAISLFETENSSGERWELQLKGAGRTPYARNGDGYAVLRSSIREFLMSEHMHALGVPTTRALALIGTSREIFRDDALPDEKQPELGAIVTRMSPSWMRFGSFEIFYSRDDMINLRKLADFAIEHVVKEEEDYKPSSADGNRYMRFLRRVAKKTAKMVAEWQAIGFNHGVMNTDNMSILGLTIDYGPYAMMDFYTPANVCNHSDTAGQYAFKRQPTVCIFDLFKFAVPLFELIGAEDKVDSLVFPPINNNSNNSGDSNNETVVTDAVTRRQYREVGKNAVTKVLSEEFSDWFMEHLLWRMRLKLGLKPRDELASDMNDVVIPLLDWMNEYDIDHHRFFRSLSTYQVTNAGEDKDAETHGIQVVPRDAAKAGESKEALKPWLAIYRHRLLQDGDQPDNADRQRRMNSVNPRFVLRNWIAQEVIEAFENKDEKEAKKILQSCLTACTHPFKEQYDDQLIEHWVTDPVPEWGRDLKCSCSS
ncbi:hypothetical protein BDB00DRAFT_981191 [Zychaea mexicana]|uniref:uncharacterized protein n=1 Tax=Zychaea mexicana TaxID=64656 RepID=UPI0022FE8416|nr:uncharacterized protein BDB00DRAFT_981191 [Zychaea mexicana]KAI9489360.1 hypothetical protein BDB00DRAFT_981191 [Zychaea mexicana]